MIFIYPYKRKENDFLINHSIRIVKSLYDCQVFTIGDCVEGVQCIPWKDSSIIKGVNVTAKIIEASKSFDSFIYMNDDFFINENFDFNYTYQSFEELERKEGKASIAWNQAVDNSKHWLEYNKYPIVSYECHQPCVFESSKLLPTSQRLEWKASDHFLKSIYFNVNQPTKVKQMVNTKLITDDISKAQSYLNEYGCFSIGQGFLTAKGGNFIKSLSAH
jgi:hypothetical protein